MSWFKKDVVVSSSDDLAPVHNHEAKSYVGEILMGMLGALLLPVFVWQIGIFLLDKAGVYYPEEFLAQALLVLAILVPLAFFLRSILERSLDKVLAHRAAIEDMRTQQWLHRQKLQASIVADSRRLGEDQRFAALILAVMVEAYLQLAGGGFKGNKRPWSKREAGALVLHSLGESQPVGVEMGSRVRPWLEEHGVLLGDDINEDRFPNLASIQRLIFLPPVLKAPTHPLLEAGEGGNNWSSIDLG